METIQTLESTFEQQNNAILYKTRASKWKGIVLTLTGILLFLPVTAIDWIPSDNLPALCILAAMTLIILGLVKTFYRKSYYADAVTNKRLYEYELGVDANELNSLLKMYDENRFQNLDKIKKSLSGGVKIHMYQTRDHKLCFSQLKRSVDTHYIPVSKVARHTAEESVLLRKLV